MWVLGKLFGFITDVVPSWFFFDELMKAIRNFKIIIEAVGGDGKCFTGRCNFAKRCAAVRAEAAIVFIRCFWLVSNNSVCAGNNFEGITLNEYKCAGTDFSATSAMTGSHHCRWGR